MHAVLAQGHVRPTYEDLAGITDLKSRTISGVLSKARQEGLVEGSRPVRLGVGLGMVLGISLGTESLRAGLVDANGALRKTAAEPLEPDQLNASPNQVLRRAREVATKVLVAAMEDESLFAPGDSELRLAGAAIAWPSPIDKDKRPKGKALRHPSWRRASNRTGEVPTLPERFAKEMGGQFTVDRCHALNDVSAHALASAFDDSRERAGDPSDDDPRLCLVVRVGGGLGASMVLTGAHRPERLSFVDTRLLEGTKGLAGELGHLPVGRTLIKEASDGSPDLAAMDYDAWVCSCGRRHHLETFASAVALLQRLRDSKYDIPDTSTGHSDLMRRLIAGDLDDAMRDALRDMGRIIGRAMAGPILMLDPYSITVTGSLANDDLVDGVGRERDMWASAIDDSVVIGSRGGEEGAWAGVRGVGLAVLRKTVYREFLDGRGDLPETFAVSAADIEKLRSRL